MGPPTGPATVVSGGSAVMNDLPTALPNLNMPAPPQRKRLTARKTDSSDNITKSQQAGKEKAEIAKIGSKGEVVISGRRLLCKICRCAVKPFFRVGSCSCADLSLLRRRELAAREHIVAHDVGKGQQAFAPNRRDMTAYRNEQDRLRREAASGGASASSAPLPVATSTPTSNPLAALRVAQPLGGGRIVQPRPSNVPRPQPVARPTPRQTPSADTSDTATTEGASSTAGAERSVESPQLESESTAPAERQTMSVRQPVPQSEPPLLPSPACSSYFVEPLSWMGPTLETGVLAGKIVCPNKRCGAKLGAFDWAGNRESHEFTSAGLYIQSCHLY